MHQNYFNPFITVRVFQYSFLMKDFSVNQLDQFYLFILNLFLNQLDYEAIWCYYHCFRKSFIWNQCQNNYHKMHYYLSFLITHYYYYDRLNCLYDMIFRFLISFVSSDLRVILYKVLSNFFLNSSLNYSKQYLTHSEQN